MSWSINVKHPNNIPIYTKKIAENIYSVGVLTKLKDIPGGQNSIFSTTLFAGPQAKEELNKAAPGMNYVVDYGILHFIAAPLFSVLIGIHKIDSIQYQLDWHEFMR